MAFVIAIVDCSRKELLNDIKVLKTEGCTIPVMFNSLGNFVYITRSL